MSIWHNEPIPTDENKDVYVEFYTQIPYVNRETKSRCIVLASDCVDLEEPDLIRWCYLDDLLKNAAEINRLREALKSQIEALGALKRFYPETYLFADDNIRRIRQALNGESEGK